MSKDELETLAAEIERVKPWWGVDYALYYFFRRWMVTIWAGYAVFLIDIPAFLKLVIFIWIFLWDLTRAKKKAWDLRLSVYEALSTLKEQQVNYKFLNRYIVIRLVFFCSAYWALFYLSSLSLLSVGLVKWLTLLLVIVGLRWASINYVRYCANIYIYYAYHTKKRLESPLDFMKLPATRTEKIIKAIKRFGLFVAIFYFTGLNTYFFSTLTIMAASKKMDIEGFVVFFFGAFPMIGVFAFAKIAWDIKFERIITYIRNRT